MAEVFERAMPYSMEAEQSLIGSALIDPGCIETVSDLVTEEDFYVHEHQEIWSVMKRMFLKSKNIDVVTLINELTQEGVYNESGGREYLKLLVEMVPTSANAVDYARIVGDRSVLRSLIKAADDISEACYSGEDTSEMLMEFAERRIYGISQKRENRSFVQIQEALLTAYEHLQLISTNPEALGYVKTGFSVLDDLIVGMGKSDLVLVGARPGMGKTAFAMNIVTSAAKQSGKNVCIFSLEMSTEQLINRMLSSEAQVDSILMRSGKLSDEDWRSVAHASSYLSELPILIDDTPGITVSSMKSKLRKVKNLGLVVIDYLQLVQGERKTDNRVMEVADISRALKLMAKEFEVPVVCCAQLSRGPETRTDKRPMLSDLRDSGAIEQDADIVMFLYRDDYYNAEHSDHPVAEVIIAKNRHGTTDRVKLGWIGKYTRFTNLTSEQME